jgi:hypothetical protein
MMNSLAYETRCFAGVQVDGRKFREA